MTAKEHIIQELTELDSSLPAPGHALFQVPVGYFQGLPAWILARVQALDATTAREELALLSPIVAGIPNKSPYQVPAGYFEQLSLEAANATLISPDEELAGLSPLLSGLKKTNPYAVPAGYFDAVSSPKELTSPAKVITMKKSGWLRYAAAAAVIAFVSVGSFLLFNKQHSPDADTASLAWVEKNMKKVSTTDIDEFLQLADDESIVAGTTAPRPEVQELLKNVSDQEIQEFLNYTGLDGTDTEEEQLN